MTITITFTLVLCFLTLATAAVWLRRSRWTGNATWALAAAMGLAATPALADPLTGEILKFE